MKRYFSTFAVLLLIVGCGVDSGDNDGRRERRRKRRGDTQQEIVKPVVVEQTATIGLAQRAQVKARADGCRELASRFRAGEIKTLWDASAAYRKTDADSRTVFDTAFQERMEKEFAGDPHDALPSNADKVFEVIAIELEGVAK